MPELFDFLDTMTPEKREAFYKAASRLADEMIDGEKQVRVERQAELSELTIADIDAELSGLTPRDNPKRYHELVTERGKKLSAATAQTNLSTMDAAEWQARNDRRAAIAREIETLVKSPARDRQKIKELQTELNGLMSDPDLLTEKQGETTE